MNTNRLKRFLSKLKKSLLIYKDGFFEFPYLAHSPQDMIAGFDKTMFVNHQKDRSFMFSKTPLLDASIVYHRIEERLWIMLSKASYKANINFTRVIDKKYPSTYYVLSLETSRKSVKKSGVMINGVTYSNISWILFKPEASNENCFLKGVEQEAIMIFFNKEYLDQVLFRDDKFSKSTLAGFFKSKHKMILWPAEKDQVDNFALPLIDILNHKKEGKIPDNIILERLVNQFFHQFIDTYDADAIGEQYIELPDASKKKMIKVESMLMTQVGKPFIGLEPLAKKAGVSISKLKSDFKVMYKKSVYQYFKSHQLIYAKQLLIEGNQSVKDIAKMLGYRSASKFAAAFKKEFDRLPSELMNEQNQNTSI